MAVGTELLTPEHMYRADQLAISAGLALEQLIDNAGRAVAEEIIRRYGARRTVVLCGPGYNGKDGRIAAHYLKQWGWPVDISDDIAHAELIIDALYGAGLNRDFPIERANQINSAGVPIVSIDVPSGLDGNTGRPRGASVKADLTITFFLKKPAHVLMPGRSLCGDIIVADIGIPDYVLADINPQLRENTKPILPTKNANSHKYRRGHAVIVSGSELHTGASRLAAQAALKIGAGLVSIAGHQSSLRIHVTQVTAVMLAKVESPLALEKMLGDKRITAVCIGPAAGIGGDTRGNIRAILGAGITTVLDADALTSFIQNPFELFDLIQENPDRSVVMTPHEGEFSKLFNDLESTPDSKIERAVKAARRSGAVVILKGADTVVAHPNGRATVNTNAPPSLATAGSGDVLAGLVTGLLAQGLEAYEAACAAVWFHGDAANRHGPHGLTAETLLGFVATNE
jgi:ADP-dependent NAD(P)H-hydrate dehydratase / NAD(P)H-hydrate epimerase